MDLENRRGIWTWWPLVAALAVAAVAVAFLPQIAANYPQQPRKTPLFLSVHPSGTEWQITWNPGATALRQARSARLYVDGPGAPETVELEQRVLRSGEYRCARRHAQPTFRLEVEDRQGHISAESFRFGPPLP